MEMNQTSIGQSADSYRRGVIFGLTMAEVFLLLVFCLLLFLAVLQKKVNELSNKNNSLVYSVQKFQENSKVLNEAIRNAEKEIATLKLENKNLNTSNARYAENAETLDQSTSVSKEVFDVVNVMDDVELQKMIENSEIASSYTPEELKEIFVKAEKWDTVTNQPQKPSFETLSKLAETLSPEQLNRLIKNSEIAISMTPDALNEKIKSAEKWDASVLQPVEKKINPHIENLIASVSVEDLELLAAGKLEPVGNNWPPIISLPEAEDYSFKVGSAQLTETFKAQINDQIVKKILKTLSEYDADLIEVIGHTDLQPMSRARTTNLDTNALNFFAAGEEVGLRARDNAGLGYARALSVTKHLLQTPELKDYTILPYSAAQMVTPNDTITNKNDGFDSSELRRIEIRVRRQNK